MSQRENIESIQLAVTNLHKAIEEFVIELVPASLKLREAMIKIHDLFYEEYKKAGFPFGDSEKGLLDWIKMLKFKADLEYREHRKREIRQMIEDVRKN